MHRSPTITLTLVSVEHAPHPWTESVHWFRNTDRFQTKLDYARRLAWDEHARGRRWLTWFGAP